MAGMWRTLVTKTREAAASQKAIWEFLFRWFLCVMGTVWLVAAVALGGRTLLFLRTSVAAKGAVVSNVRVEQRSDDGRVATTFAPEFTFIGADGKSYTVMSASSSNPPEFAEGQAVRVLYNPVNPGSARIDSFRQLWLLPILFGAFGVVASAIGCTWMYFVVKRNREVLSIR
jgi:hypothetical protein